ncbi:GDP-D-glucose phosphorylase activity protein [Paramecium bursaria]
MDQNNEFDTSVQQLWRIKYEEQRELFRSGLKFVHKKVIHGSNLVAYFNLQLIENKRQTEIVDPDTELVKDYDPQSENFLNFDANETLLSIDIDNSKIQSKMEAINTGTLIKLNVSPICSYHSLIVPYIDQGLSQVLSGFLTETILNIYKLTNSQNLRIGFNSILANSSINHLHLHLLYADQLFENAKFPIESYELNKIIGNEVWQLSQINNFPLKSYHLRAENGIGEKLQIILDALLSSNIPHNLFFTSASSVYIFPRKSQFEFIHDKTIKPAFIEFAGLILARSKQFYEQVTIKDIEEKFAAYSIVDFETLTNKLKNDLSI